SLDYNRQSQEIYMPPSVEDITDFDEQKSNEQGLSGNELSAPEVIQREKQLSSPSDKTEERQKSSSSSRPKTAHSSQTHSD
ncbi:unnamed protein product, partial [Rotaria magnacalcarata]